jgi:hypothetical protein
VYLLYFFLELGYTIAGNLCMGKYGVVERQRHIVFNIGGGEVWFDDGDGLRLKDEWTINKLNAVESMSSCIFCTFSCSLDMPFPVISAYSKPSSDLSLKTNPALTPTVNLPVAGEP